MIHLSRRAINLHSLTEDSGCHKTGETFDLWKAQHNTFCSCIFAISLPYRTELLSSECGKLTRTGLCQTWKAVIWKSRCFSCEMVDRLSDVFIARLGTKPFESCHRPIKKPTVSPVLSSRSKWHFSVIIWPNQDVARRGYLSNQYQLPL